jgi:hypothetical protein
MRTALENTAYALPDTFQVASQNGKARIALAGGPNVLLVRTPQGWKIVEGYPLPFPF